jgi:hypothetical protein
MFPLAGKDYPTSSQALADSIQEALGDVLTFAQNARPVIIDGGDFPALESVRVDLSNATISTDSPPPPPKPMGDRQSGPTVKQLNVIGKPVRYQGSAASFELAATGVSFDFARDAQSQPLLVLTGAESGHVDLNIDANDLQSLLRAAATIGARQQGVTIQDLQVTLTSQGPRTVDVLVRVKAKKMMMSGAVVLRGRVEIDDALVATLSNLSCTGEGMMGNMAAGMLQTKLRQFEGKQIPLTTFSLGELSLCDLKISTDNGLRITADVAKK